MPLSRVEIHGRLPEGLYDRDRTRALNQLSSTLNSLASQGKVLADKTDPDTGVKLWSVPVMTGPTAEEEPQATNDDAPLVDIVVDMDALQAFLDAGKEPENRAASGIADILPTRVADFLRAELLAAGAIERPVIADLHHKIETLERLESLLSDSVATVLAKIREDLRGLA